MAPTGKSDARPTNGKLLPRPGDALYLWGLENPPSCGQATGALACTVAVALECPIPIGLAAPVMTATVPARLCSVICLLPLRAECQSNV